MSTGKARAEWLPETTKAFVKALCQQKAQGHMVENGFKPVVWSNVATVLKSELHLSFNPKQLKNQWASVSNCLLSLHIWTHSLN